VRAALAALVILGLLAPTVAGAEGQKLDWETGEGRSYAIPALEVAGFIFAMNQFNRHLVDSKEYGSDFRSIGDNLTSPLVIDRDPFSINQLGHPYQGNIYYGFARSAGLDFWRSLVYKLGAAILSPPTGFNRLAFGDRFHQVFPSHNPAIFIRFGLGVTLSDAVQNDTSARVRNRQGAVDYSISYGLPGKPGYEYKRPFDYFHFEFTAVPNAREITDAIENVSIRGLLAGRRYALGETFRGVWGVFGNFDYFSPQIFRVSETAASVGTVFQWWLSRQVALQGTVLGGLGLGAAGTVGDRAERDYHYGLAPMALLGLRLIFGDRAMLEPRDLRGHQPLQPGRDPARQRGLDGAPVGPARPRHPVPGLEP